LRHVQAQCGATEMLFFGNRDEIAQLPQLYIHSLVPNKKAGEQPAFGIA